MTELLPFFSAEWCEAAIEVCNAEPKVQLIQALEAYPTDEVRQAIEPFLGDMSEPVRFVSVTSLFTINDPQSLPGLLAALATEESRRVQNRIAQGLADRGWVIPPESSASTKAALPPGFAIVDSRVQSRSS